MVLFTTRTDFHDRVAALGIPVYLQADPVYSGGRPSWVRRQLARLVYLVDRWVTPLSLPLTRLVHGALIRRIVDLVREHAVDLVHMNNQPDRDLFGYVAAQRAGVPVLGHIRSTRTDTFNPRKALQAARLCRQYVANSQAARRYWIDRGLPADRIEVVPNALAPDRGGSVDLAAEFGVPAGTRVLLCVANLQPGKGHRFLLDLFADLLGRHPDLVLLLAGDGPLRGSLEQHALDLGIARQVLFAGYRADARRLMRAADLLLVPSRTEAFGLSLLEGMDAGIPVVATDVGGIPEILRDGRNGLLVPYGDVARASQAVSSLLDDPALARRLAEGGRLSVTARYSPVAYADAIARIHERLVATA